jgi:hypothetical protein
VEGWLAAGLATALALAGGCGSDGSGRALPPPHAGSYEAYGGAGRHQHFRLRVGDRLTAAVSERGVSSCVGAGRGCVRFSAQGSALSPAGEASASRSLCNDAKHRCVYARQAYRTVRVGRARLVVLGAGRTLMTVDVDVRKAPNGYTDRATAPQPRAFAPAGGTVARGGAAARGAAGAGSPTLGLYKCYLFDPTSGYLYGGGFTLVDAGTYASTSGGGGTYQVEGDQVRFLSGPFAEFAGQLRQDDQGNDVIDITLQSDPSVKESCASSPS